jgi:hypothetical protein
LKPAKAGTTNDFAVFLAEKGTVLDTLGISARLRESALSKHPIQMAGVTTRGRLMGNGTASRTLYCSFSRRHDIIDADIAANSPYQSH